MYTIQTEEKHKLGLERLTPYNRGLYYDNEREVEEVTEEGTRMVYQYDVYELSDIRTLNIVKNTVITDRHPYGDELKILRKTLYKLLNKQGLYDTEEFKEFKEYNNFVENI